MLEGKQSYIQSIPTQEQKSEPNAFAKSTVKWDCLQSWDQFINSNDNVLLLATVIQDSLKANYRLLKSSVHGHSMHHLSTINNLLLKWDLGENIQFNEICECDFLHLFFFLRLH